MPSSSRPPVTSNWVTHQASYKAWEGTYQKERKAGRVIRPFGYTLVDTRVAAKRVEQARSACQGCLEEAFRSTLVSLRNVPGGEALASQVAQKAQERIDTVLENFQKLLDPAHRLTATGARASEFRQAVKQAHVRALEVCGDWQKMALDARAKAGEPQASHLPTVSVEGGVFTMSQRDPLWETGVFRGGGAKGLAYGAALLEMEQAGLLKAITCWVGTSAGGLSALYMACNHSAEEFNAFIQALDTPALRTQPANFESNYPSIQLGKGLHHGGEALRQADLKSREGVTAFFSDLLVLPTGNEAFKKDGGGQFILTDGLKDSLEKLGEDDRNHLLHRLPDLLARPSVPDANLERSMVTFRDLQVLHRLAPDHFKALILTGFETETGRPFYFNATTTPDLPVAFAARVSMSIPKYFKPVSLKLDSKGPWRKFVDGGVGSNIPVEAALSMRPGRAMAEALRRTLVMAFDDRGAARDAIDGNLPAMARGLVRPGEAFVTENPELKNARWSDRVKLAASGANAMVIKHGDIDTTDFEASDHRRQVALQSSRLHTLEQLNARAEAGMRKDACFQARQAYGLLSPMAKAALREASDARLEQCALGRVARANAGQDTAPADASFLAAAPGAAEGSDVQAILELDRRACFNFVEELRALALADSDAERAGAPLAPQTGLGQGAIAATRGAA